MAKFKTKFDSLLKIKKLKVNEKEREIIKINHQISKAYEELKQLQIEIDSFEYPKEGSFSLITQFKMMQQALFNQLQEKQNQIKFLKNQKNILTKQLKELNLDYEKMKYLQGEEIKKYIQKIKKQEAKDLDEIALMLYKG